MSQSSLFLKTVWQFSRIWVATKTRFKNSVYYLIDFRILNGPFSIRALLWPFSYHPFYKVDVKTGELRKDTEDKNNEVYCLFLSSLT